MDWLSFIQGLACLAAAIQYLFSGISFGVIPPINYGRNNDTKTLACLIMKGSTLFSVLYFIIIIVDMYYGYYDGFILTLSLIALMSLTFLFVSLARNDEDALENDSYSLLFFIFQALLLIKLSHTSYFIIDNKIHYQLPTSEIKGRVLTASLILELLQLLF
ncbi:unnamed protein product [Rotaria sordida]|uniref:Uncharacterized protein n=1 Tax=Rotaria sordida TaxID=392033 RepID=A0A820AW87_9BILA|nr:unnamed protein product [Rotaria sordida]CAF1175300.1 unnamed protein product [Rotaria sordida]CAF1327174.1 unnamed protein product [Rotaria sordida]CAF3588160.1 unnamed protein product [Rotaria sordida]CAF4193632.1 unnamed protein product [Rotaria sordida]